MAKEKSTKIDLGTNDVGELIRKAESDYISGVSKLGKYVEFSQYENIERIDAYLNSKHMNGDTDNLDREKPFFNIVTAAVNIWYRATDIDRKDIRIKSTKLRNRTAALLANIHLQDWMRKANFGTFLNDWGRALARYGSTPVKFVEKGGELFAKVIPWNRLISDTVDFENNPKIEVLYLTPAQLMMNKSYDQEMVKSLLDALSQRKTAGGETVDNKSDYVKVYELHGKLALSKLTGKPRDKNEFVQQMHVCSFVEKKEGEGYDDFTLYQGKEKKDPYMLTHLIKEDGRAQSIGAVESLFDAQWMVNHSQKLNKDQLDLASKIILQTQDGSFVNRNVLTNLEVGDILIHKDNSPITKVDVRPDIAAMQSFGTQWMQLAQSLTSTPDALRGENAPSGTAWRQVEALRQESHSLFEQMIENKCLHIETMMREFVIPFEKKQLDTTDEVVATLDSVGITQIDNTYIPNEAIRRHNRVAKEAVLGGSTPPEFNQASGEAAVKGELAQMGNQRYFAPSDLPDSSWKKVFEDIEWQVEVDGSGEASDKQAVLDTLNMTLKTIVANPTILQDPNAKLLFNKILETTDAISPLELASVPPPSNDKPVSKVSESMNFKDLPADGQEQMAKQAGIDIKVVAPSPETQTQPVTTTA